MTSVIKQHVRSRSPVARKLSADENVAVEKPRALRSPASASRTSRSSSMHEMSGASDVAALPSTSPKVAPRRAIAYYPQVRTRLGKGADDPSPWAISPASQGGRD